MPEPGGRASSSPLLGGGPEPTLAEMSSTGRKAWSFPDLDVPAEPLHIDERRKERVLLAEVAEHDIVMHFTRLAHRNFAVDLGAYPLGSCTMKYNPKVADSTVGLFAGLHPDAPTSTTQGALEVLVEAERVLCELTGMYRATFQPAAGAAGELTGMMITKAYHTAMGNPRSVMLVPDSAHGTNPASAALAGYTVREVPSNERGLVDLDALREMLDEEVAGLMLTNPNTPPHRRRRPRRRWASLLRRRESQRDSRRGTPRGHGFRHRSLQPPQDVCHPARRWRTGVGTGSSDQDTDTLPARTPTGS